MKKAETLADLLNLSNTELIELLLLSRSTNRELNRRVQSTESELSNLKRGISGAANTLYDQANRVKYFADKFRQTDIEQFDRIHHWYKSHWSKLPKPPKVNGLSIDGIEARVNHTLNLLANLNANNT